MLLLRPGVTGFGAQGEVNVAVFKRAIYAASLKMGASVLAVVAAESITPNFHRADIRFGAYEFCVVCNRAVPIIAFAKRPIAPEVQPIAVAEFADPIRSLGFEIGTAAELSRLIEMTDLQMLSDDERKQAQYWKPKRIGQIVFNWWD